MGILSVIFGIFAISVFYNVFKSRRKGDKVNKRQYIIGAVFLVLAIGFAASGDDGEAVVSDKQHTTAPPTPIKTLNTTVDQFRKRYDSAAELLGISTRTDSAGNVTSDTVSVRLNTPGGFISNAVMAGAGDGTAESGVEIMSSIIAVIMATSPELNENGRNNVMRDLGLLGDGLPREQKTATVGNVKYSFMYSDEIGSILTVSPAK